MGSETDIVDVIIVGGSHSGLSAALTLYRATHTSLIFDAGEPRNSITDHVHMTPTWNGKDPDDLREACRKELLETGLVQIVMRKVVSATRVGDIFEVVDSEGQHWKGKKILLAMGVIEKHPNIPGFTENYGKHIYHCMFCFGYEDRGSEQAAILATGPLKDANIGPIFAADAKKFVDKVKIYTDGNAEFASVLHGSGKLAKDMEVDNRKLINIAKAGGKLEVQFDEGPPDTLAFMVHSPEMPIDRTLPEQLGCEIVATGIKVNPPFNSTTAPGVYAAGDCCSGLRSVLMGMTAGSCAGVGIARELPGRN